MIRLRMEEDDMHIGVDTHKKTHVLGALDARGQVYGTHSMANTPAGWAAALQWARDRGADWFG